MEFIFDSLNVFSLSFKNFVFLSNYFLKLGDIAFEVFNNIVVIFLQSLNFERVNFWESFFDIIKLLFILPFDAINFVF